MDVWIDIPTAFKTAVRLARTRAFQKLGASVHLPRFPECVGGSGAGTGGSETESASDVTKIR